MGRERWCPCGSGAAYDDCCRPLHDGTRSAETAEQLMRSRYSAFVLHEAEYLLHSWHPATRPATVDFDPGLTWTGLEIVATEAGEPADTDGIVEFRAHHRLAGEAGELHEVSRFRRHEGEWRYVRGRVG